MGDIDGHAGQHREAEAHGPPSRTAFQTQFDFLPKSQPQTPSLNIDHYGAGYFNMGAMSGALPQAPRDSLPLHSPYEAGGPLSPNAIFQMQHNAQYISQQAPTLDMSALRAQSQHFQASEYSPTDRRLPGPQRSPSFSVSPGLHRMDSYGYSVAMPHFASVDSRFGPQGFPINVPMGSVSSDYGQYNRRLSESIPSFPRGPPRKPKQSGHALWVGNLPPAATVIDLKDHFSRDATKDIESLFLISKSNCAFVNYRTEAACAAAMNRFHDSRFHGVRLVCRLRRGSSVSSPSPDIPSPKVTSPIIEQPITEDDNSPLPDGTPMIVGGSSAKADELPEGERDGVPATEVEKPVVDGIGTDGPKILEKFFIIKSLTVQDLEASVQNGTWATQSHNETALNEAFSSAENVYLVFSANKSGEYFGYARMASLISGEPVNLGPSALTPQITPEENSAPGTPQSIMTPATETAPKGRIIDDSARGTIFWEAEHSEVDGSESPDKERNDSSVSAQNWGKQFKIEWLSTSRLPFYRTRGLRNPWNANREVKIARDGTELEPGVGRRLAQMFHRPPSMSHGQGLGLQQSGVPYH